MSTTKICAQHTRVNLKGTPRSLFWESSLLPRLRCRHRRRKPHHPRWAGCTKRQTAVRRQGAEEAELQSSLAWRCRTKQKTGSEPRTHTHTHACSRMHARAAVSRHVKLPKRFLASHVSVDLAQSFFHYGFLPLDALARTVVSRKCAVNISLIGRTERSGAWGHSHQDRRVDRSCRLDDGPQNWNLRLFNGSNGSNCQIFGTLRQGYMAFVVQIGGVVHFKDTSKIPQRSIFRSSAPPVRGGTYNFLFAFLELFRFRKQEVYVI